jgi:hypothetical protein
LPFHFLQLTLLATFFATTSAYYSSSSKHSSEENDFYERPTSFFGKPRPKLENLFVPPIPLQFARMKKDLSVAVYAGHFGRVFDRAISEGAPKKVAIRRAKAHVNSLGLSSAVIAPTQHPYKRNDGLMDNSPVLKSLQELNPSVLTALNDMIGKFEKRASN